MKYSVSTYLLLLVCSLLFITSASAQLWTPVAEYPVGADARHHPVTFAHDGFGYVMIGTSGDGELDDAYRYEENTGAWSKLVPFPGGPRGYAYGATSGDKAYVGFGLLRQGGSATEYFNDLWEYTPAEDSWKQLADCPCEGRSHPAFVTTEDKVFVGLGNGSNGNFKDWWEYDIASDTWSQKPDFIGARRHHPYMFEIDGLVYVAFGHGDIIYNDLHVYDPATEEWKFLNFLPSQGRVAGTQFSYGGKGYVLSGDGDTHENLPAGEMWSYDPATNEWEQQPSHPGQGRWAPGSFVIGDNLYFTGGLFLQLWNDLIVYDLAGGGVDTDDKEETLISVFPNPTSGIINIDGFPSDAIASLYDVQGRIVLEERGQIQTIDISHLEPGQYVLKLISDGKELTSSLINYYKE